MPNLLNANGLQIASITEIVAAIVAALKSPSVYGPDINTDPETPDGQQINIFAQAVEDELEVLLDTYNIFFPDSCYGVSCDQLFALNGITRKPGSFTQTWVQVTVSGPMTLPGTDQQAPFTAADQAGNPWQLVQSFTFPAAGTYTLLFEAEAFGAVQVSPSTIQNILTPTAGVTGVDNPSFTVTTSGVTIMSAFTVTGIATTAGMTPGMLVTSAAFPPGTTVVSVDSLHQITVSQGALSAGTVSVTVATPATVLGLAQENDVQFKVRRSKSFNLQTVGPAQAIRAALLAITDVSDAYVPENDTAGTVNGVPAHGVWIIVTGGSHPEIGGAIYAKKQPGCAMAGAQTYNVPQPQGDTFLARWDASLTEDLYVRATLVPKFTGTVFDLTVDAQALAAALVYKLGQSPSIGDIVNAMNVIEPDAVLSNAQVSVDGSSWFNIVTPSDFQHYFVASVGKITLTQ